MPTDPPDRRIVDGLQDGPSLPRTGHDPVLPGEDRRTLPGVPRPPGGSPAHEFDDRVTRDPIVVNEQFAKELWPEADPLLLLPLRLEYRMTSATASEGSDEIWFRWYPDDGFAEQGIEPPDEAEQAALDETLERLSGRGWWETSDDEVVGCFVALAHEVGAARAVHLLRGAGTEATFEERSGHLALLPRAVTLFTIADDGATMLAVGAPIERDALAYSQELFADDHWFFDFDGVVERGMGLRLTDPESVRAARAADWIVAVGLHEDDAVADIESLFSDGVANGSFAFLRQDAPTNNGDGRAAHELAPHRDLLRFLHEATEHERGLPDASDGPASGLLAQALGLDRQVTDPAPRSADTGIEDARAMIRVVLPALLERLPDEARGLDNVDVDDLIDFFADWISARGQLPAVRLGDQPYGVLPVTRLETLEPLPDDDETNRELQEFLRSYAARIGPWLAEQADQHVPVIQPGDVDAARAFEEALKVSAVSRRIDVDTGASGLATSGVRPVGCPYVTHPDHDPRDYLEQLRTTQLGELPDPTADDDETPLLYRLARRAASRRVGVLGQFIQLEASPQVAEQVGAQVDGFLGRLGEADLHVEPGFIERFRSGRTEDRPGLADEMEEQPPLPRISGRIAEGVQLRDRDFIAVSDQTAALQSLSTIQTSSIATLDEVRLPGFDGRVVERLQRFTRGFGQALAHLRTVAARPDGAQQLETLLFETVDLVQHRVDAWAAGLAYRRLVTRRRRADLEGLRGGYYGLVGRLRPPATASTDGYLQAPSPEQATTAAVLRSAHLRFRDEGAFDVDLSSSRVRHATGLYTLVQRGLSLEEILGLSGERWLHDRRLDRLIAVLRERYPLRNPDDDQEVEIRLFDGRRFLEDSLDFADDDDRSSLEELHDALDDDLDALADLVMAEAVHQRVQGNSDAAHAWLQVLSGDVGPSEPSFQQTHRRGHTSPHAVLLLVDGRDPDASASPRVIAEPSLAAAVADALPNLDGQKVTVVLHPSGDEPGTEVELALSADLGVTAWDLVVGGRDELRLRATVAFLRRWQTGEELQTALGAAPSSVPALAASHVTEVRIDDGLATVLSDAHVIRRAVSGGRPLQLSDLQATAPATEKLTESDGVERLMTGLEALRRRAETLGGHMADLHDRLRVRLDTATVHARNLMALADADANDEEVAEQEAQLGSSSTALRAVLEEVSRTAEPRALLMSASTGLRDDPDGYEQDGLAVLDHLADGRSRLTDALAAVPDEPTSPSEARRATRLLIEALRQTLDGDALPVLVPVEPTGGTRPVLDDAPSASERLESWVDARTGIKRSVAVAEAMGLRCFAVGEAAIAGDLDDPDDRDPAVAPRSTFHGTVLSPQSDPAESATLAGVVVDEWAESTPSREQVTGLAINHVSPSNEAPNVMLLCEPPSRGSRTWSVEDAADMVVETVRWMKVRALTTEVAAPSGPLLAGCNRVAQHLDGRGGAAPRVPRQEIQYRTLPVREGQFIVSDHRQGLGHVMLNEATSRRSR